MKLPFVVMMLVCANTLAAQSTLRGVVLSPDSMPLAAVRIQLVDSAETVVYQTVSDSAGRFAFKLGKTDPTGAYLVTALLVGYQTVSDARVRIEEDEVVLVRVRMHPSVVLLEPIEVVARSQPESPVIADYRERAARIKKTGFGRVLERPELQHYGGMSLPRMISSRVAGVSLVQVRLPNGFVLETLTSRGDCRPTVLLDRLPVAADALDTINLASLEGIEIYRDITEVPAEFASYAHACALILAWTADGDRRPLTFGRVLAFLGLLGSILLVGW